MTEPDPDLARDVDACCRLTGRVHAPVGPGGRGVLRQVPLRDRARAAGAGGGADGAAGPGGHRAARRPRAGRGPDRDGAQRRTGLPALFVRKQAKEYGTCKLAEGPDVAGRRVTLVEDVITTGGAVRDATARCARPARPWRPWSARSTAARRGRTRSPTSGSRCARCSPRPTCDAGPGGSSRRLGRRARPASARRVSTAAPRPSGPAGRGCRWRTTRRPTGITENAQDGDGSRSRCSRPATGTRARGSSRAG